MSRQLVHMAQVGATTRDAATTLKAALVVAAAAILSQAAGDLQANAEAAETHFATFRSKLDALRDNISRGSALAVISTMGTVEIDSDRLDAAIAAIDRPLQDVRDALAAIVASADRDGLDVLAVHVGELGGAFHRVTFGAGEPTPAAPFQFEQFFLESLHDLSQRDWGAGAT